MSFFSKFRAFPEWRDASSNLEDAVKSDKKFIEAFVKSTETSFVEFVRKQHEQINDPLFRVADKFPTIKQARGTECNNLIKFKEDFDKIKTIWDDFETKKKAHAKVTENCEKSKKNAEKAEQNLTKARARSTNEIELQKAENNFDIASRQKQVDIANFEESERNMAFAIKEYKVQLFQQILVSISNYASSNTTNSASLYQIGEDMKLTASTIPTPEDPTVRDLTTQLQALRAEPVDQ